MTKRHLINIEGRGLKDGLGQVKGQRKVLLLGDFSQYGHTAQPVQAWSPQPAVGGWCAKAACRLQPRLLWQDQKASGVEAEGGGVGREYPQWTKGWTGKGQCLRSREKVQTIPRLRPLLWTRLGGVCVRDRWLGFLGLQRQRLKPSVLFHWGHVWRR